MLKGLGYEREPKLHGLYLAKVGGRKIKASMPTKKSLQNLISRSFT